MEHPYDDGFVVMIRCWCARQSKGQCFHQAVVKLRRPKSAGTVTTIKPSSSEPPEPFAMSLLSPFLFSLLFLLFLVVVVVVALFVVLFLLALLLPRSLVAWRVYRGRTKRRGGGCCCCFLFLFFVVVIVVVVVIILAFPPPPPPPPTCTFCRAILKNDVDNLSLSSSWKGKNV